MTKDIFTDLILNEETNALKEAKKVKKDLKKSREITEKKANKSAKINKEKISAALKKILPNIADILIQNKNKSFSILYNDFSGTKKYHRITITCKNYR